MNKILKQNASISLKMGPFLDTADGYTEKTSLNILASDVLLSKNQGALTAKSDPNPGIHDTNGYYSIPLSGTDVSTLGSLKVVIHKTGALPVWDDFVVLPVNVYDALVNTSGTGLLANTVAISSGLFTGVSAATAGVTMAVSGTPSVNVTSMAAGMGTIVTGAASGVRVGVSAMAANIGTVVTGSSASVRVGVSAMAANMGTVVTGAAAGVSLAVSGQVAVSANNDKTGYNVTSLASGLKIGTSGDNYAEVTNPVTVSAGFAGVKFGVSGDISGVSATVDPASIWTYDNRTLTTGGNNDVRDAIMTATLQYLNTDDTVQEIEFWKMMSAIYSERKHRLKLYPGPGG